MFAVRSLSEGGTCPTQISLIRMSWYIRSISNPMITTLGRSAALREARGKHAKRRGNKKRVFIPECREEWWYGFARSVSDRADGLACLELGPDTVVVAGHVVKGLGRASFAETNLEGYAVSALWPVRTFEGQRVDDTRNLLTG